jgi:hypothetical protein
VLRGRAIAIALASHTAGPSGMSSSGSMSWSQSTRAHPCYTQVHACPCPLLSLSHREPKQQRARQLQTACRHRRVRAAARTLSLTGPYRVLCIAVEPPPVTCISSQPGPPELEALECCKCKNSKKSTALLYRPLCIERSWQQRRLRPRVVHLPSLPSSMAGCRSASSCHVRCGRVSSRLIVLQLQVHVPRSLCTVGRWGKRTCEDGKLRRRQPCLAVGQLPASFLLIAWRLSQEAVCRACFSHARYVARTAACIPRTVHYRNYSRA